MKELAKQQIRKALKAATYAQMASFLSLASLSVFIILALVERARLYESMVYFTLALIMLFIGFTSGTFITLDYLKPVFDEIKKEAK